MTRVDGSTRATGAYGADIDGAPSPRGNVPSVLPVASAEVTAASFGDVAGLIAMMMLRCNRSAQDAARTERQIDEQREADEQNEQLSALHARANEIFAYGVASGAMQAASGCLSFASCDTDVRPNTKHGLELMSKLASSTGDGVKACGERAGAEDDVEAKQHEQTAAAADRRLGEAKDGAAELQKLARDVVDFVREFERSMDAARTALIHGS